MTSAKRQVAAAAAGAIVLGIAAFATTWAHSTATSRTHAIATLVVTGLALLVSGVLGWLMRPASRVGPLLCLTAALWWLPYLQDSEVDLLASLGYAARDLWLAALVHIVLTYPDGRASRWTYAVVVLAYLRVLVPNVVNALLAPAPPPLQNRNFSNVGDEPGFVVDVHDLVAKDLGHVLGGVIAILFVARLVRGTRVSRTAAIPLVLAAVLTLAYFTLQNFTCGTIFGWSQGGDTLAFAAIPLAFLVALTGGRRARGRMGSLLVDVGDRPDAGALRNALARALRDPTLELTYRLGPDEGWVTPDGVRYELPAGDPRRTISYLERDGEQVAAIVHDAALASQPERLEPVRRAARLLLDNEQLTAQVRHQLGEVRASRRRILEAGDQARRAVERDLHDGAQQRLVGLALNLRLAERTADPATALLLDEFAQELEAAIAELRELARGIHPSVVTESGLPTALGALAKRSPVPLAVEIDLARRYPDVIEATVYYVVAEALTNVVRYASASAASLTVFEAGEVLHVEIRDDGVGGASVGAGSGLSGLRDRVEAIGGALVVESPPGGGTRVVVRIELQGHMEPTEGGPRDAGLETIR